MRLHSSRWIQAVSLVGLWSVGSSDAGYGHLPNALQLNSADCSEEVSHVIDQLFHALEKCHEAFEQGSDLLLVKVYQEVKSTFQKLGELVEPFLACQPPSSSLSNVVTQYMLYAAYYEVLLEKKNIPVSKAKALSKNKRFETLYSLLKAYVQVMNLPKNSSQDSESFLRKMAEFLQQKPSRENRLALQKILQNFHVKQYYQVVVQSHHGALLSSKCETKNFKKTIVQKRKTRNLKSQQAKHEAFPEKLFQGSSPVILDSAIGKARLGGGVQQQQTNLTPFSLTQRETGNQGPVLSSSQSMNPSDPASFSQSPQPFKNPKEAQQMIQQVYSTLETHDLSVLGPYRDYSVESILRGLSFASLTDSDLKKKYERIVQELEQALVTLGMQDQKNYHEILLKDLEVLWAPKTNAP